MARRLPAKLGGGRAHRNMQCLCTKCQKRKTRLECSLLSYDCTTETVREWFRLAFGDDVEEIERFVGSMRLRTSHFREVLDGMRNP